VIAAAEVAWTSFSHWRRLEPDERERLFKLARKSGGRPGKNLSASERREAEELLRKLGHIELAGDVAQILLPFRPLSRLATRIVAGRQRDKQPAIAEAPNAPSSPPHTARPPAPEPKAGSRE
jgi:hypothetical protein